MITLADNTTILVSQKLKKELDTLKEHHRESYAEVIAKLVHQAKEDEEARLELSESSMRAIEEAKEDIRRGRLHSLKQVRKELGLS